MLDEPKSANLFKSESTFNNAFKLYCFDRELRKSVLRELEKIEVAIRAKMIYVLSHAYGPFWYTDPTLFTNVGKHTKILSKIRGEYERSDEKFIIEFRLKYNNPYPPSWMMLELISFGSLSEIFKNLSVFYERRNIANCFGLDDGTFESWLHSIVYVRNVCAHHTRLWSRVMRITPAIPLNPRYTFLNSTILYDPITNRPTNSNRTYFLLSMIVYLLNVINPNHTFRAKLQDLLRSYPMADVQAMGFPFDWQSEPLWS